MSNIQPYQAATAIQPSRRVSRALDGLSDQALVQVAQVQQRAVVQTAKADAVAYVGQAAMHHVTMISQLEGQLAQLVPLATSRLEAIANATALGLAEVVVDTATRTRNL